MSSAKRIELANQINTSNDVSLKNKQILQQQMEKTTHERSRKNDIDFKKVRKGNKIKDLSPDQKLEDVEEQQLKLHVDLNNYLGNMRDSSTLRGNDD